MAALKITSNGQVIYPAFTVDRDPQRIGTEKRMLSASWRGTYRAEKVRLRYGHDNLNETELATWRTAHPFNTTYSHTDELSVTRTVRTVRRSEQLNRSVPLVEAGLDTTGATYYTIEVELEEV